MKPDDILLRTDRLEIRLPGLADVPAMFDAVTPCLTRYLSFDPPTSVEALAAIVLSWRTGIQLGNDLHLALHGRGGGGFLGMSGLHGLRGAEPDVGIWIKEAAQGQGLGREAVRAVARFAFDSFGMASLLYPVAEANLPSRRLVEGLGGVVCGSRSHRKYQAVVYRITPEGLQG